MDRALSRANELGMADQVDFSYHGIGLVYSCLRIEYMLIEGFALLGGYFVGNIDRDGLVSALGSSTNLGQTGRSMARREWMPWMPWMSWMPAGDQLWPT